MKILKQSVSLLLVLALFISCDDNGTDSTPGTPSVSAPDAQSVVVGSSVDITFNVSVEAGYESASVSATNGNASISSEPSAEATSGDVVVSYTGNSEGAGSVTLEVTDVEGQKDDATAVVNVQAEQTEFRITSNITSNTTWEDGKTYELGGRIIVEPGNTLTIEGGAVIKGDPGQGSDASVLLVARDATLNANGTASQPIIFTSTADDITPEDIDNGNFASPNLANDAQGTWGGVIILGNAPISVGSGNEAQIEGIPSSETLALYGGNDPNDSSGSISHISIRHGGTNIGQGNEINGLSLGGVGSGTSISNVEIVANQDDGVEFFGGTVSVTNVLVWNNGDDAIDTDQAWDGEISNIVIANPGGSAFELDGPEGSATSQDGHLITDASVHMGVPGEMIDVDPNTDVNMKRILFFGLAVDDNGNPQNDISDDYNTWTDDNGNQQPGYKSNNNGYAITNLEAVIPSGFAVADFFDETLDQEVTEVSDVSSATVGATDVSVFNWTWASQSGDFPSEFGL